MKRTINDVIIEAINLQKDLRNLKSERKWDADSVRGMCIRENFYTKGTNEEYSEMLDYVDNNEPTEENLFWVAVDIKNHTADEQTITNIMYILEKDVVRTFYTIDGRDDI